MSIKKMICTEIAYLSGHKTILAPFYYWSMFSEKLVHSCLECMVRWENFENLSEEEISLVNENRYEAAFKPGEIILKQGSPASSAVFLATGMAKVYMEGLDGRNFILGIVTQSDFLASPGAHIASSHTYSVSALTFVQACFVSIDIINNLISTNPAFARGIMEASPSIPAPMTARFASTTVGT